MLEQGPKKKQKIKESGAHEAAPTMAQVWEADRPWEFPNLSSLSQVVNALHDYVSIVQQWNWEGNSPLHIAAVNFDNKEINRLLAEGADANAHNANGHPPLVALMNKAFNLYPVGTGYKKEYTLPENYEQIFLALLEKTDITKGRIYQIGYHKHLYSIFNLFMSRHTYPNILRAFINKGVLQMPAAPFEVSHIWNSIEYRECAKILLDEGKLPIDPVDTRVKSPLYEAVQSDPDAYQAIKNSGGCDYDAERAFLKDGSVKTAREYLQRGADMLRITYARCIYAAPTPLAYVEKKGSLEMMNLFGEFMAKYISPVVSESHEALIPDIAFIVAEYAGPIFSEAGQKRYAALLKASGKDAAKPATKKDRKRKR